MEERNRRYAELDVDAFLADVPLPREVPEAYALFLRYYDDRLAALDAEFIASDDHEARQRLGMEMWRVIGLRTALTTFLLQMVRPATGPNTMH